MKIIKFGTVTIAQGPIRVEGWLVKREDTDPPEPTTEQLLLVTATDWALVQLKLALEQARTAAFKEMLKREGAKQLPAENETTN